MSGAVQQAAGAGRRPPRVKIAPGFIAVNISGSSGGVSYVRQHVSVEHRRAAKRVAFSNVMIVDHTRIVRAIDAAVKKVDDTVLRHLTVKTSFGHFVPDAVVDQLRAHVDEVRALVDELNEQAAAAGSRHRGRVGVVLARLDVTQPDLVAECCRTVAGVIADILTVLRVGDVVDTLPDHRDALRPLLLRAKNIETIAVGESSAVLQAAMQTARTARSAIRAEIVGGATPAAAGSAADLAAIELALGWWST